MALVGDTIKLTAEFTDFNGIKFTPNDVKLRIYDGYRKQIGEDILVLPNGDGKYQHDYVVPSDAIGPLYAEFSSTVNGLPVVGRQRIDMKWI